MNTDELILKDDERLRDIHRPVNPVTGEGEPMDRIRLEIPDYPIEVQYVLPDMYSDRIVQKILEAGSISAFINAFSDQYDMEEAYEDMVKYIITLRCRTDFIYWAFSYVKIKNTEGGQNIPFSLNRPQRRVLPRLEKMRLEQKPIRAIICKARQWGGSTLSQIYIAWIQLVHKEGFYSAIVAQDAGTSRRIRAMYTKMLQEYPAWLVGSDSDQPLELTPYEGSYNDATITQGGNVVRDTVISIGTAERPDNIRGSDISCAHMSEVAMWKETDGKKPEDIVRSVSSSILNVPYTVDIMESTANGVGNFFHNEWLAAKSHISNRDAIFVAWYDIDLYSKNFATEEERYAFADNLLKKSDSDIRTSDREESGRYLWSLWEKGATLEAINWYITTRRQYNSHSDMASEFPSDDIEAFTDSGQMIFNRDRVEKLRHTCKDPSFIGDMKADATEGKASLHGIRFQADEHGSLSIWQKPDTEKKVRNRYLVVVDVGGRSEKADWSDILVIDRYWMMEGDLPEVVAEWHGHIRMDRLAWKMAQIATWYNKALLVVESNTYEKNQDTEGDHTEYILNQIADEYDNLYAREASEQSIREGISRRWGFQTNRLTKPLIIDNLNTFIDDGLYIEREKEAINEFLLYEKKKDGSMGAVEGKHDDRLMTRAIGLYISQKMPRPSIYTDTPKRYNDNEHITEAIF